MTWALSDTICRPYRLFRIAKRSWSFKFIAFRIQLLQQHQVKSLGSFISKSPGPFKVSLVIFIVKRNQISFGLCCFCCIFNDIGNLPRV